MNTIRGWFSYSKIWDEVMTCGVSGILGQNCSNNL